MPSPQILLSPPEDSHNDVAASDDIEEDEEIPVANPSTDILYDLSNALNQNLSECFKGAFSFCRTYKDAPNPGLLLGNDIGVVGLPLSSRDAAAIKSGCQEDLPNYVQNVDESCLSWTLAGGAKLRFVYPNWDMFVQRVAKDACAALGANIPSSKAQYILQGLSLYEPGSSLYPSNIKERSEARFATLTILLPSHFAGGSIRFTHGYLSETHKPHHSSWHTTALATYTTDHPSATATVQAMAKPITFGHALALHYDLVHTADTPCPVLPDNRGPIERIRHVLRSWKQALTTPSVPRKVVHLLDGSYEGKNLRASVLKGLDGQKVEALRMLVKDEGLRMGLGDAPRMAATDHASSLGPDVSNARLDTSNPNPRPHAFNLALATLKVRLTGMASDPGPNKKFYDPMHPWRTYDANGSDSDFDDDDWEDRDIEFADVEEAEFSVEGLVDLDGKLIKDKFMVYEEDLDEYSIPSSLREAVQEGDFVKQEYGGWQWDEQKPGWLERHYKRTVLFIWPQAFDLDRTVEDDIDGALKELDASALERPDVSASQALHPPTPNRPHPRERNRIDFLFNVAQDGPHHRLRDVAQCLFAVATRRRDLAMWLRVADECAPNAAGEAMECALVRDAIRAFGFEALATAFETTVRSLETNAPRFNILKHLHAVSMEQDFGADNPRPSWVAEQRQWALDHLALPSQEDVPILAGFVCGSDGLRILQDRLLPQLTPVASADFLRSFAVAIWSEAGKLPDEDVKSALAPIITDLLNEAISKADFEHKQPEPPRPLGLYATSKAAPEPNLQAPCAFVCACVQTGNESLADGIVKRLVDLSKIERYHRQGIVKSTLLPLVSLVSTQLNEHLVRARPVQRLFKATVELFLASIPATPGLSKADVETLVKASAFQGGAAFLADIVWPSLCSLEYRESIILDFVQALYEHRDCVLIADGAPGIDAVIILALQRIIENARFEPYSPTQYPAYYGYSNASQRNQNLALHLLTLCLKYDQIHLCSSVFARLFDRTLITPAYIQNVLVPFLPQLRHFLNQNELPPHAPPFDAAFTEIVALWARHVLGPRPPDPPADMLEMLSKPSCHCQSCVDVFTFLNKSADRAYRLERIGAPKRQHVEQELFSFARGAATWQAIGGTPQGLLVTKTDVVYLPIRWKALHAQAGAILRSISIDEAELQLIFGLSFQPIVDMLHGMFYDSRGHIPSESTQPSTASAGAAPRVPSASASNTEQPAPSTLPDSRKRKAEHLTGDVIDLTHMEY